MPCTEELQSANQNLFCLLPDDTHRLTYTQQGLLSLLCWAKPAGAQIFLQYNSKSLWTSAGDSGSWCPTVSGVTKLRSTIKAKCVLPILGVGLTCVDTKISSNAQQVETCTGMQQSFQIHFYLVINMVTYLCISGKKRGSDLHTFAYVRIAS